MLKEEYKNIMKLLNNKKINIILLGFLGAD